MEKEELNAYKIKTGYNLRQLELDYYQHLALAGIYREFNTIYFKGGTCLQKCYGIKRFSEDLDFNFFDLQSSKITSFLEELFQEKISGFHETKFGITFSIRIQGILFNGDNQTLCRISFDFRENDIYRAPMKKIIRPVYHDLSNYFILALDSGEILAEKVRAIMTRFKARDVYDLNELLLNDVQVDFDLINKKLNSYDQVFDRNVFSAKLEEKRKIYNQELQRLTRFFDEFDRCMENILKNI
ncbi:MAG: nucleotidyl transferase AbiEii/AbiGii toxin family protein [Bacteroidota bacterium]